jgi:hypothetical protein
MDAEEIRLQPPKDNRAPHHLSQEEIDQLQTLLAAHRRTLAGYLYRRVLFGESHTPPAITNGIADARAQIARVKAMLRASDIPITDHPDDR